MGREESKCWSAEVLTDARITWSHNKNVMKRQIKCMGIISRTGGIEKVASFGKLALFW